METVNHQITRDTEHFTDTMSANSVSTQRLVSRGKPLADAYAALLMFMLIYFVRPGDWIPGLWNVPLAKITGVLALLAVAISIRQFGQRFPREVFFLFLLVGQLFIASLMAPVWRGGAFLSTLGFAKLLMIVPLMTITVTTLRRLRLLIFTQSISVSAISAVVIWKGHLLGGRLDGILGGNYGDPNDIALTIILVLPLCLGLLFLTRNLFWKLFWFISVIVMTYAVFLTGSRGGFVAFVVVTAVCLWEFAIRGRRRYLLLVTAAVSVILWQVAGGMLAERLKGTFEVKEGVSYSSAQSRQQLFWRSIDITNEHPFFGVGPGNFEQVSGQWHTTHNSLTLMSSEGGIPALILYALILWSGFKNLRATIRLSPGRRESSVLARALCASLAGYAVGSLFLSWSYMFLPYILVAYTTALFSIELKSSAQSRNNELARQATDAKKVTVNMPESEMFCPTFSDSAGSEP